MEMARIQVDRKVIAVRKRRGEKRKQVFDEDPSREPGTQVAVVATAVRLCCPGLQAKLLFWDSLPAPPSSTTAAFIFFFLGFTWNMVLGFINSLGRLLLRKPMGS